MEKFESGYRDSPKRKQKIEESISVEKNQRQKLISYIEKVLPNNVIEVIEKNKGTEADLMIKIDGILIIFELESRDKYSNPKYKWIDNPRQMGNIGYCILARKYEKMDKYDFLYKSNLECTDYILLDVKKANKLKLIGRPKNNGGYNSSTGKSQNSKDISYRIEWDVYDKHVNIGDYLVRRNEAFFKKAMLNKIKEKQSANTTNR